MHAIACGAAGDGAEAGLRCSPEHRELGDIEGWSEPTQIRQGEKAADQSGRSNLVSFIYVASGHNAQNRAAVRSSRHTGQLGTQTTSQRTTLYGHALGGQKPYSLAPRLGALTCSSARHGTHPPTPSSLMTSRASRGMVRFSRELCSRDLSESS